MNKLLLINVSLNWGSTGKIVEGIGTLAQDQGWDVYVAHGARYINQSILKPILVSNKYSEYIHYFISLLFDAQGLGSRCSTKRLIKIIDEIKPDIIHIHNIHGCYLNYPLLFSYILSKKIKVVWTLHDCWAFTGHCVYFERASCNKWQSQCFNCPQLREFPKSLLDFSQRNFIKKREKFTSLNDMHITTVSVWLKNIVGRSFLSKYNISVIPNGIDTQQMCYQENNIKDQLSITHQKMLLAVATGFSRRKGLYDYVRLASLLPNQYRLVLVGVSDEDDRVLPRDVIKVRPLNGIRELANYYSAADVLLNLSYEETFGMTIVEAMSCGTPVIVYDNTAQSELITMQTGRVVPTGDLKAVLSAIDDICMQGKDKYFVDCKSFAENYEQTKIYRDYINLYTSILSKN